MQTTTQLALINRVENFFFREGVRAQRTLIIESEKNVENILNEPKKRL